MGKIIGLIPARGGSKGIPHKAISLCANRPLISYTAGAALSSKLLDEVIVSTDDVKIKKVAEECGLSVPFLRPAELSQDDTPMNTVIQHAYCYCIDKGAEVDALVLLQPTSPLRTAKHIDEAVALYRQNHNKTLVSVIEVPHRFHPYSIMQLEKGFLYPCDKDHGKVLLRQYKPVFYARNGPAILILPKEKIISGDFYSDDVTPYLMDELSSVDIDFPEDLYLAALLLKEKKSEFSFK